MGSAVAARAHARGSRCQFSCFSAISAAVPPWFPGGMTGSRNAKIPVAIKRQRAFEAYARGATYDEIAREVGYASRGAACAAVRIHIDSVKVATVEEFREREIEHLRQIIAGLWVIVRTPPGTS